MGANALKYWKEFGNSILKNRVLLSIILIKIVSELNEMEGYSAFLFNSLIKPSLKPDQKKNRSEAQFKSKAAPFFKNDKYHISAIDT